MGSDAGKLGLFAIEALGLVGVVFVLQRIIRIRKRRSDPVNVADGKPRFLRWVLGQKATKKPKAHDN